LATSGRVVLGVALEVFDVEDRVREHLGGSVVNVPVEPLSLGLETAKHALRNLDGVVVAVPRWVDARAKQIGGARLDVLHHELQLLETAVAALGYLVE